MDPKSLERFVYALIAAGALVLAYSFGRTPAPSPAPQPSVPSLIPPAVPAPSCPGTCNPARMSTQPFNVVCPYCKNTLAVTPSSRPTGDVAEEVEKAAAK